MVMLYLSNKQASFVVNVKAHNKNISDNKIGSCGTLYT